MQIKTVAEANKLLEEKKSNLRLTYLSGNFIGVAKKGNGVLTRYDGYRHENAEQLAFEFAVWYDRHVVNWMKQV